MNHLIIFYFRLPYLFLQLKEEMQIGNGAKEFDHSLPSLCLKWFKTSRKVRKEHDWQVFYQEMLVVILPEMDPLQVLVPKDILH